MIWLAFIKAVSLTYLLGMVSLVCARLLWSILRPRLAPTLRADAGFGVLAGVFLLNLLLGVIIWLGVTLHLIRMTTNYFHHLMYGGWSAAITISGAVLFVASLFLAYANWRRGYIPAQLNQADRRESDGLSLRHTESVPTLSLVGAWRPEVWINPGYWTGLTPQQQDMALYHERVHRLRRDNLKRLVIWFITGLYAILPGSGSWRRDFELDCEVAVDGHCRNELPLDNYIRLISSAAVFAVSWRLKHVASHLSAEQLSSRLTVLNEPSRPVSVVRAGLVGYAVVILAVLPTGLVLLHPLSRCLCACYLGY